MHTHTHTPQNKQQTPKKATHIRVKRAISWNYLYYLIDPSFQGVNWLFVLSFEYNEHRKKNTQDIFFKK